MIIIMILTYPIKFFYHIIANQIIDSHLIIFLFIHLMILFIIHIENLFHVILEFFLIDYLMIMTFDHYLNIRNEIKGQSIPCFILECYLNGIS
jgi:hypothetical protein